jgi:hypothetical protein
MPEADNHRRWPADARGVYEVWYLTWNDPRSGAGYWLRYVIEQPTTAPAFAQLWFARFDPADPARTFGIHRSFPIAALSSTTAPFGLTIATCRLAHDHATGAVAGDGHDVRWDLRWQPAAMTLRQLPEVMYARGGLGETTVQTPGPRVPLSGAVEIDGERVTFDHVPAGQTHLWGKKHAFAWTWGRCADLRSSRGPHDAVLELLAVRLHRRGVTLPTLALASLDLDGEALRWNQFRHTARNRATWSTGKVAFAAWSPTVRLDGELTCRPEQLVLAPYLDPDGTEVFCANTEVGEARLTLWRRGALRWKQDLTLTGTAHFETGGRDADPAITHHHRDVG